MIPSASRGGIIVATAAGLAALAARRVDAELSIAKPRNEDMDIDIKRIGSRPSTKGSAEWFTGAVRVDPLFQAPDPARAGGAHVTFEPGLARRGTRIRSARH